MCQRASQLKGDQGKVESWSKSVGTFISKTFSKYWHFRDALAPFVVSKPFINEKLSCLLNFLEMCNHDGLIAQGGRRNGKTNKKTF